MSKSHFVAVACMLTLLGSVGGAQAAPYTCPPAAAVKCVPTPTPIDGWNANGGEMTGNAFALNNQCQNVINNVTPGVQRLFCCYTKCGVYIQDVKATKCIKTSRSTFTCN